MNQAAEEALLPELWLVVGEYAAIGFYPWPIDYTLSDERRAANAEWVCRVLGLSPTPDTWSLLCCAREFGTSGSLLTLQWLVTHCRREHCGAVLQEALREACFYDQLPMVQWILTQPHELEVGSYDVGGRVARWLARRWLWRNAKWVVACVGMLMALNLAIVVAAATGEPFMGP